MMRYPIHFLSFHLLLLVSCISTVIADGPSSIKFTTFNTMLIRLLSPNFGFRRDAILDELKDYDTDILCLQEIWNANDLIQFVETLDDLYPYSHYELVLNTNLYQGRNGLLLLSKLPLEDLDYQNVDSYFINRGVLLASVNTTSFGKIKIACTHLQTELSFPPYLKRQYEDWVEEAVAEASEIVSLGDVNVVMGDLNSGFEDEQNDILEYQPEVLKTFIDAGYQSPYKDLADVPCSWCADNNLAGEEWGNLVIDHVLLRNFTNFTTTSDRVLNSDATVPSFFSIRNRGITSKLSDHAGVRVVLHPI